MEHSFGLSGGHSVRLVSQSSEHLLLLTVEGSQATAIPVQKAWKWQDVNELKQMNLSEFDAQGD
ncbi:hypothetical protein L195_g050125 [Trifolium pratense]|uniref:Uncharacterized protein n=1 Tax=Trifolium pratense TaxID=57577 RepID=A0A2K3JSB0_TRIPR|nr:hypothetical protein L195_g050125 [Trifolium pratense]